MYREGYDQKNKSRMKKNNLFPLLNSLKPLPVKRYPEYAQAINLHDRTRA